MSKEIKGELHNHDTAIHIQHEDNGKVINHTCIATTNGALAEAELFAKEIVRRWNAFEQQPTAGEWTKKLREFINELYGDAGGCVLIEENSPAYKAWFEACDIIDKAKAINKDLLEVCEKFMKAWLPPETRSVSQLDNDMNLAYHAASVAIAKAKK